MKYSSYQIQTQNNLLIFNYDKDWIYTIDLESGKRWAVELCDHQDAQTNLICANTGKIYFTVQIWEYTDGWKQEVLAENENNGLWVLDPATWEKTKVSSELFDSLYLYDEDLLFGTRGNHIYQINMQTFEAIKIV